MWFIVMIGCGPQLGDAVYPSSSSSADDSAVGGRSVVGGVTAYQEHPLGGVTIGLLDYVPNETWGTDDAMVVVDETISDSNGNYAVQVGETSRYWLLGTFVDRYGPLASIQRLELSAYDDTTYIWADLAPIVPAAPDADCTNRFTWTELSYTCCATDTGELCAWKWGTL